MDCGENLGAGDTVDGGVMHPQEYGERALGQVVDLVEPVDQVQLPGRSAQVERPGVNARDLGAQLPPASGLG